MNYQKCFGASIRTTSQKCAAPRIDGEGFSRSFLRQEVASRVSQQSHQKVKHATNLPAGSPSFVAGGISRGLGLARALNIWDRFSLDAHSRIHRLGHPKCGRLGTADWTPSLLSLAWC